MASGLDGLRILVVQDEYFIAADLQDALEQRGASVIGPIPELSLTHEVIRSDLSIDAALIDIDLRGLKAFTLVDELRLRGVPLAFLTGFGCDAIPQTYQDVPRFEKPCRPEDVLVDFQLSIGTDRRRQTARFPST